MKIGLYVHIPFCKSKCHYCDFLSFSNEPLQEAYVDALVKEIENQAKVIRNSHTVQTIFMGGGTPTVLPPFLLGRIAETIRASFRIEKDVEWSIESNPGTITKEHVEVFKQYGINRVSLGLQTCEKKLLKTLGRIHSFEQWEKSVELLKSSGIMNINTDLMFALPGQTLKDWEETLRCVVSYDMPHLSAYSLIIEEGTPFYALYEKGELELAEDVLDRQMYDFAKRFLKEKGYNHYEISNWALPGMACKHNKVYWQQQPYIGLGLGAHSYFKGKRYHNLYDLNQYIDRQGNLDEIIEDVEEITLKMQQEECIFLGLRLLEGISLSAFEKQFGMPLEVTYKNQIDKWIKEKALIKTKERVYLSEYGIDISNTVFSSFL